MNRKILGKISLTIASFFMMAAPVFAQGNNEATITYTHQVYEEINVRENPLRVTEGEVVTLIEEVGDYYKVALVDGYTVYVEKEYLEGQYIEVQEVSETEAPKEVEKQISKGEELVNFAKQYVGTPYAYGGTNLNKGVDCSGFVSQVYSNFDMKLQRSSRDQYASNGTKVTKAELQKGDLVFYGYSGSVSHVGIYAGDGMVVHSSTSKGVVIDPLDLRGMPPIIGYKRVLL
jgi:cell wall-associated NlpC family hydrolase